MNLKFLTEESISYLYILINNSRINDLSEYK